MTEATIAAPSQGAAPISTTTASPAPAAPAPSFGGGGSVPTSTVDPGKFPIREDYAAALLKEKLAALPESEEQPVPVDEALTVIEPPSPVLEIPVDEAVAPAEESPVEEDFQLELEAVVTPEVLSQMVTDNPEFGKLLEADSRLKGQLYKTAREAAELKPLPRDLSRPGFGESCA